MTSYLYMSFRTSYSANIISNIKPVIQKPLNTFTNKQETDACVVKQ